MKKMVWVAILVFTGMVFVVMPGLACSGLIMPVNQGSGVVDEMTGADFDTGELSIPPGCSLWSHSDIWWERVSSSEYQMTPVHGATIFNLGVVNFDTITGDQLFLYEQNPSMYSTTPIPGNQLVNGDVFAVHTQIGHNVKVKVLDYGDNILLKWVTYNPPMNCSIPEFPSAILPVTMIIGFIGAVLLIRRTREY